MASRLTRAAVPTTFVALLLGAGCGAAEEASRPTAQRPPPTTTEALVTTRESRTTITRLPRRARILRSGAPCLRTEALVTYQAGDGAWFRHEASICSDGRATFDVSHSVLGYRVGEAVVQISPPDMRRIRQAVDAAGAAPAPSPPAGGADFTSYEVTYGGATLHTHQFALGDGSLPERSVRLIRVLETVVGSIGEQIPTHPPGEPPGLSDVEYDARAVVKGCVPTGPAPAVRDALERLKALLEGGIARAEEDEARRHVDTVLNNC